VDPSRYAELFLTESREHLSAINHLLLALEREPGNHEPVRELFRAAHTIKGMSAAMGYAAVADLTHELESVLDRVRRGDESLSPVLLDLLFTVADALERGIELAVAGRADELDPGDLIHRLRGAGPRTPTEELPIPPLELAVMPTTPAAAPGEVVARVRLAAGAPLPGVRAFLVVQRAETIGRVVEVLPPVEALQAGKFDGEFTLRLETTLVADEIVAALKAVGDVERVTVDGRRENAETRGLWRATRSVRVELGRLDNLTNLIGELVIARGRLAQLAASTGNDELEETLAAASRLIAELQSGIMSCRMVPVGQIFDRFPRLVRDAGRRLGKRIEFDVEGQQIELDRSMLDEIGEPIVHLLRNAVDHGIELPEARAAAGKPEAGHLTLSASRERSSVVIRVEDDGRGIDRRRVLEKARALALVDGDASDLSEDDLLRLIARPGFSTATEVTELSGRGVGIDVVQSRVRALGGTVEIRSAAGVGTVVTVRLPLTLAIVRALLARVGDETYAVPLTHVDETVELEGDAVRTVQGREVMIIRGDVLPLLRSRSLLYLPAAPRPREQVIVLEIGERRAGLVVDELTGQQDIVVKQYDPVRGGAAIFGGATILPNGSPALIVDAGSLL
jgi:two-component system, chemotaxis family, sensor kinase CheA